MGHMNGKDIYRKLGKKIDNLTIKTPWTETFRHGSTEYRSKKGVS